MHELKTSELLPFGNSAVSGPLRKRRCARPYCTRRSDGVVPRNGRIFVKCARKERSAARSVRQAGNGA